MGQSGYRPARTERKPCYAAGVGRVLLVSANREQLPSPVTPLGLLSVAGSLRAAGHEVGLCDLCFEREPLVALRAAIEAFGPTVVGLGLRNLHSNAYDGTDRLIGEYAAVARAIRAATPAPLLVGGSAFSLQPQRLLTALGADHGVVGEGEAAAVEIVDALERGDRPPPLVQAAAIAGGATLGVDLDALAAPARDLVDPRYYAFDGTANLQSRRGCAFQCAYCDYPDLEGRRVRVRSPAAVADELFALAGTPGVTHAFFVDSVFNVPRAKTLAVCDAIVARFGRTPLLPWVCYASPFGLDDTLVAAMARAGCVGAELGSDSANEGVLRRLRKPFKLDAVFAAHELFRRHDLLDCHTFVLGAESAGAEWSESLDEARRTLETIDRLDPDVAAFIVFTEDREARGPHAARRRQELLALLAVEAPKRPGWIVPELGIRFGEKLTRTIRRYAIRGPAWLYLARQRRAGVRGLVGELVA